MYDKRDVIKAGGKEYTIIRNLGCNQNAGIYIALCGSKLYLLKDYSEGNKNASEIVERAVKAYIVLEATGIRLQKLINYDIDRGIIVKEYFMGEPAATLLLTNRINTTTIASVYEMAKKIEATGLVLDYFPTNFIVKDDELYYVIYEYEERTEANNFDTRGSLYWLNAPGLYQSLMLGSN